MKPAKFKRRSDHLKTHLRASWRYLLVALLRLTFRVQSGLDTRVQRQSSK